MKVEVKDIGDKWNQLPEEEKNKYIQMGKLQSEQYAQLKTVVQQKPPKVALPNIVEKSNAVTLSQGRIDNNDDSRLAKVEKQVIEIHALLVQGHKDARQDEVEKRLTKVENQVEKILELLEKHMPVDGEQVKTPPSKVLAEQRLIKMENQVGQILELLERRIPFDGGHVKHHQANYMRSIELTLKWLVSMIVVSKGCDQFPKFVDEDEIRNMNDKEPMETLCLRKTKPILTPPNAKKLQKRAKLLFDNLLDQIGCNVVPEIPKVQSFHKLLQYAHGEDYVQDVSSFAFQWLEDMPRQDNSYDCGLFVIKYMQGKPLPSGVIKLSDLVISKSMPHLELILQFTLWMVDVLDALPEKRRCEDGGYSSDDGKENSYQIRSIPANQNSWMFNTEPEYMQNQNQKWCRSRKMQNQKNAEAEPEYQQNQKNAESEFIQNQNSVMFNTAAAV
ncbi:hypothetical protein LOK49_LG09G01843 [Camellia lanceoleosa]|uniref:Uncharacterized protein n=1 Tax=Camellia lanceoleosa TaxID=1840588 RepID=A0ACC0GJN6_9ERIC|nr:hypothetical protein LOK49_LG09G01843 [Camellia lanceoleosa]